MQFVLACLSTIAVAQGPASLLLPKPVVVSGTVVDKDGRPVVGARVDHTDEHFGFGPETDAEGKFELKTRAPALVVRRAGFRSVRIRTEDPGPIRVVLESLPRRSCTAAPGCRFLDGWGGDFCIPQVRGVSRSRQGNDHDYGAVDYFVTGQRVRIMHGAGPNWSKGFPNSQTVWGAVEYSEISPSYGVVDARGKTAAGKYWRYLGKFGESASYHDVDEATAKLFDQVLDGVCVGG